MEQLLFLLIILACPLMMMLMMRGSHGGHAEQKSGDTKDLAQAMAGRDARIAELERQVTSLHARLEERDTTSAAGQK
jgi:hypothetical protein